MISNFTIKGNKIILKNTGEYFGAIRYFEYNIGDKLYKFAVMNNKDFKKLKAIYSQLIKLVCYAKETDLEEEKMDCFFKMFQVVRACLEFSPYTHFYTQVLIDIIVKTYNTKTLRSDLLLKSQIGVLIENSKYYPSEIFRELEEDEYTPEILLVKCTQEIDKVSNKKHNEYMKFFETIRDLLIENLMEKKTDLKERLELINKYSNNSLVRSLSVPEKLFLYETKRVFDIHYFNTKPTHALFLDSKFKTTLLSINVKIVEDYFIPATTNNNPYQKARNDQKYCNNLYLDTGKTCKKIGATNKHKEKVENSSILKEYNREYKRMHGLHYNHPKKFTEKKFKEWSKKARELRDSYNDEQLDKFKIKLKNLSNIYITKAEYQNRKSHPSTFYFKFIFLFDYGYFYQFENFHSSLMHNFLDLLLMVYVYNKSLSAAVLDNQH